MLYCVLHWCDAAACVIEEILLTITLARRCTGLRCVTTLYPYKINIQSVPYHLRSYRPICRSDKLSDMGVAQMILCACWGKIRRQQSRGRFMRRRRWVMILLLTGLEWRCRTAWQRWDPGRAGEKCCTHQRSPTFRDEDEAGHTSDSRVQLSVKLRLIRMQSDVKRMNPQLTAQSDSRGYKTRRDETLFLSWPTACRNYKQWHCEVLLVREINLKACDHWS